MPVKDDRLPQSRISFGHGPLRHLREALFILAIYLIYVAVRQYIAADIEATAFANATKVVSLELAGGLFRELSWQDWTISHSEPLIIFMNWVYILSFGPIITVAAVIIYIKDRTKYLHYRNVLLVSFIFALIGFGVFPLAPPRFLPEYGFVDTIRNLGPNWWIGHSWQGSPDTAGYFNVFAAMPSLHFGWTVMFGIIFLGMKSKWVKLCGVIYPALTFFSIVLTGNHYILDAVGGAAVAIVSVLLYSLLLHLRFSWSDDLATVRRYQGQVAGYFSGKVVRSRLYAAMALASLRVQFRSERLTGKKWRTEFRRY